VAVVIGQIMGLSNSNDSYTGGISLDRLTEERGAIPDAIVLDDGPEPTSRVLDQWAYERGVRLHSIGPANSSRTASSRASTVVSGTSA
jgi:hypothetical protein